MKKFPVKPLIEDYFKFIKKFLPQQKSEALVGLDIGAKEFKLVEVAIDGADIHLVHCAVEAYHEASFTDAVGRAFDRIRNFCRFYNTAVNGKGTLVRFLDFPRMTPQEFQQSFAIEADKYFPFPPDQIYTDFHIVEENSQARNMSVIVAAAKREIVDKRLEMLKPLKLPVGCMALHSMALASAVCALGFNNTASEGGAALLDIGENVTTLIIFTGNIPRFTHDIYIGGRDMTRRVSNVLGLSVEEAEHLKCAPGDRAKDVSQAVESVILNIIQEVRLSFDYFVTEKHMEVSRLYLTGGASTIAGLDEVFRRNLEIPIERWNIFGSGHLKYDQQNFAGLSAHEQKLGVAFGLALYRYGAY